jgi:hypothetical protein
MELYHIKLPNPRFEQNLELFLELFVLFNCDRLNIHLLDSVHRCFEIIQQLTIVVSISACGSCCVRLVLGIFLLKRQEILN